MAFRFGNFESPISGDKILKEQTTIRFFIFWKSNLLRFHTLYSSDRHMRSILSGFRKSIFSFKSTVRTRKKSLLKKFAKIFIIPKLHNLEFVEKLSNAHISRFDYLLCKYFSVKSNTELEKIRAGHPGLYLQKIHSAARRRYAEDF